jgi:hypothetical protein
MSTQPEVRKDAILSREHRVFPSRALSDACEKLINKDVRRRPFLAQKHIDPPARGRIWIVLHCHPSASVTRARPINGPYHLVPHQLPRGEPPTRR